MSDGMFTKAGVLLIVIGMIGGVAAASTTPVHRCLFIGSVVAIMTGIIFRRFQGGESDHGSSIAGRGVKSTTSELEALRRTIVGLIEKLERLGPENQEGEKQIILDKIEDSVLDGIPAVLSSLKSLQENAGRVRRAVATSLVSEGERYLNRAWSALSDGYRAESMDSLKHASDRLEEALTTILNG